jgi:hypothetical protein
VIYFFMVIQSILLLFMALHDWIDLPPFTNLPALKKAHSLKFRLIGSAVNAGLVLIPLIVTFIYLTSSLPLWARVLFVVIYGLITFGTITAWWIPYFGGGFWIHGNKAGFEEYRDTHSFLPSRGDNVVPNTLHVILHIQVWICFGLSLYWLCCGGWIL